MLTIIILILISIVLTRTSLRFSRKLINFREFILWVLVWVSSIFLIIMPNESNYIAKYLGIGRGADAVFFIAILALLFIIFRLYSKIEDMDRAMTELTINVSKEIHKREK